MNNGNKIILVLIILFPTLLTIYYFFKSLRTENHKEVSLKPLKIMTSLYMITEIMCFLLGLLFLILPTIGIFKLITMEIELSHIIGILIMSLFVLLSFGLTPFLINILNHLWFESKRTVLFNRELKTIIVDNKTIDLKSENLTITKYEPCYWIIKPILYNRTWSIGNHDINRKIKFKDKNLNIEISSILDRPDDLIEIINNHQNTVTVRKKLNWMNKTIYNNG
jgi:hypothetical protein